MLIQLAPPLQTKFPTSVWMVSASPTCPHTLCCLASLGHQVLGQGHCWAPSVLTTPSLRALRKDPPKYPDAATERSLPRCLGSMGIGHRHRYLWYLWHLKRKWTLILTIIFLIRFKKCIRSNFHSCCWFVSTSVPASPCCLLYGLQPYFRSFKEMFFSPLSLHETSTWTTARRGRCLYPQPCQVCKANRHKRSRAAFPSPSRSSGPLSLAMT